MLNPLLGVVCAALYGVCVSVDALRQPRGWLLVPRHAVAAVPVVLAVAAGAASRVTEGAGSALDVGFSGFSRNYPVTTLLLSLGPVLVPAVVGLVRCRADRKPVTIARQRDPARSVPALLRPHLGSVMGRIPRRSDPPRVHPDPAGVRASRG